MKGFIGFTVAVYATLAPAWAEPVLSCGMVLQAASEWEAASPSDSGIDEGILCPLREEVEASPGNNIHAFLVIRHGRLVYEAYFPGEDTRWAGYPEHVNFTQDTLHDVRSISKSIVSLIVGAAIDQGLVVSVNETVLDTFPDLGIAGEPDKAVITLHSLLTMTAGFAWDETDADGPFNDLVRMSRSANPYRFVFDKLLIAEPGTHWNYSSGNTQLVAGYLQRRTGKWLDVLAEEMLFRPLDIREFEWMKMSSSREPAAGWGLRLRPRDIAKIGQLVLDKGMWKGTRILSEEWIELSTAAQVTKFDPIQSLGYGYHWWTDEEIIGGRQISWISAQGFGGQRLYIVPQLDIVVVVTAGLYGTPDQDSEPYTLFKAFVLNAILH